MLGTLLRLAHGEIAVQLLEGGQQPLASLAVETDDSGAQHDDGLIVAQSVAQLVSNSREVCRGLVIAI